MANDVRALRSNFKLRADNLKEQIHAALRGGSVEELGKHLKVWQSEAVQSALQQSGIALFDSPISLFHPPISSPAGPPKNYERIPDKGFEEISNKAAERLECLHNSGAWDLASLNEINFMIAYDAVQRNSIAMLKILEKSGYDFRFGYNTKGDYTETLPLLAIECRHFEVFQYFDKLDVLGIKENGHQYVMRAVQYGFKDVLRYLFEDKEIRFDITDEDRKKFDDYTSEVEEDNYDGLDSEAFRETHACAEFVETCCAEGIEGSADRYASALKVLDL